jgi:hypothetical protein
MARMDSSAALGVSLRTNLRRKVAVALTELRFEPAGTSGKTIHWAGKCELRKLISGRCRAKSQKYARRKTTLPQSPSNINVRPDFCILELNKRRGRFVDGKAAARLSNFLFSEVAIKRDQCCDNESGNSREHDPDEKMLVAENMLQPAAPEAGQH